MCRSRTTCILILVMTLTVSVSMTSCGTGGDNDPDLVLIGFNLPNLSGIVLNNPLIFTFSANVAPGSITPDSLRVVGVIGPFFETTVVDGNLVGLLPRSPNFEDYSDVGMAPDTEYTVSLTTFPAVTTIESVTGKPLLEAESFTFKTQPFPVFIEPRRPIIHGTPYTLGGRSDDAGCLQNSQNALYVTPFTDPGALQTGTGPGASLLCLQNEGPPSVIEPESVPRHDEKNFGSASPVAPGLIQFPAIRIRCNESLDPLTVAPYIPTTQIPVNVQLWRVGQKNNDPLTVPERITTNKPVVVQDLDQTEIILVPTGPISQGVYLVNVSPAVTDLPGNPLRFDNRPDPQPGGYDLYEAQPSFSANVPPGFRIYFKTLEIPDTPLSIIEDFNNNLAEWGDNDSVAFEPGINTNSVADAQDFVLNGLPLAPTIASPFPSITTTFDTGTDSAGQFGGQNTTAAWNSGGTPVAGGPISDVDGYRFLNLPHLLPNPNPTNPKPGTLQAVYQPYCGSGQDSDFTSTGTHGFNTDSGSVNGDGVFEFNSFNLQAGHTILVAGSRPLLILCKGDFILDGTIVLNGANGGAGFDDDGSGVYDPANGAISLGGDGGAGGAGGGNGGKGADPRGTPNVGSGGNGQAGATLFGDTAAADSAGLGPGFFSEIVGGANDQSAGGGGGAFGGNGGDGTFSDGTAANTGPSGTPPSVPTAGTLFGDMDFMRALALFTPDRGYQASSNITGGSGGSGGSADDDNGASEIGNMTTSGGGDDGGGGGGGGGGGLWAIVKGNINIGSSAAVTANGGDGGDTYAAADQDINLGADGMVGGTGADQDFLQGVLGSPASGSGDGGPGGGGAGGGLFFVAKGDLTVAAGATLQALGGQGGTSGDADRDGGNGGDGRITLMTFDGGGTVTHGAAATTNPAAAIRDNVFFPSVDLCSVAQSDWVDLFTSSTEWAPLVMGNPQFPTFNGNFAFPGDPPGFLQIAPPAGAGKTLGVEFDVRWEFQGAADLSPQPAALMPPPMLADGLTPWVDLVNITAINFKRYMRWRFRFFHKDGWGEDVGDPPNLALATILNAELPFVK